MHYIFYHGRVTPEGARNVETLVLHARAEGISEVTLCLASEGGDVTAGIGLYNFLKMRPVTLHTHAMGPCQSIAATIYMAGAVRTAVETSNFVLHAAVYVEGPQIGQQSPNTDLVAAPFKALGWTDEELKARFSSTDFRFAPSTAISLGIVHRIIHPEFRAEDTMITVRLP